MLDDELVALCSMDERLGVLIAEHGGKRRIHDLSRARVAKSLKCNSATATKQLRKLANCGLGAYVRASKKKDARIEWNDAGRQVIRRFSESAKHRSGNSIEDLGHKWRDVTKAVEFERNRIAAHLSVAPERVLVFLVM